MEKNNNWLQWTLLALVAIVLVFSLTFQGSIGTVSNKVDAMQAKVDSIPAPLTEAKVAEIVKANVPVSAVSPENGTITEPVVALDKQDTWDDEAIKLAADYLKEKDFKLVK